MITHRLPFPPNKGDKIRSFNILKYLSVANTVYVASVIDNKSDLHHLNAIRAYADTVIYSCRSWLQLWYQAVMAVCRRQSISVRYFYAQELQKKIDKLLACQKIDAVICYSSPMAEYVFRSMHYKGVLTRTVLVCDLIDVDSQKWEQYAKNSPKYLSWIFQLEARHLAGYEQRIAQAFQRVLVVSEDEITQFPNRPLYNNIYALRNGVDLEYFSPMSTEPVVNRTFSLVFVGVMNYLPNVKGIIWFVRHVLPLIQLHLPSVRLEIVGSNPTREVVSLGELPGVTVTGYVDDVRVYLSHASVVVAPLKIARGIQNKVLEAMAMAKPVVCTPEAFIGIDAPPSSVSIASDAHEFAHAIIQLLDDPLSAERMGREARRFVEKHCSWQESLNGLVEHLEAKQT